ncbi:MAG TPA: putative capsular polysaccharide synthesis family protein [Verrucomicrobiae bacterium]|nr:putative capsular polysaccharide synthesis family protein [Verrucomicrobiae bacterium]
MNYDLVFSRLLLIYQMPKTGSQTVEASLQQCSLPHRVLRFHFLSQSASDLLQEVLASEPAEDSWKASVQRQLEFRVELLKVLKMRKLLRLARFPIPKIEVITGMRESIGLALSSIFENRRRFAPGNEELTVERCRELLFRPRMFKLLNNWFDLELKPATGVDVFATPFPREKGYAIYESRLARVLVYRLEALSALSEMLREFLGCEIPAIVNRNVGEDKAYAAQYDAIKKNLRMPRAFVAQRYTSRPMRHFYSEQELERFSSRWSEPRLEPPVPAEAATGKR